MTAGEHYHLPYWSEGYARTNAKGELCIHPDPENDSGINLHHLSQRLLEQGLRLPALVRFPGILHHRVKQLTEAFAKARQEQDYQGGFTPVYPIKVNQQCPVVEQLIKGQQLAGIQSIGLEAGSKPELIAVLAQLQSPSTGEHQAATIVCNGYKDIHFIRLALMAEKLGHKVFLVIEKLSELTLILQQAKELKVTPRLGVRARLATIGKGNWQNTGGDKSKFGLSAQQILQLLEQLKQQGQLNCLQLLHFHLGSQLANIHDIQRGLAECGRIYAELIKLQAPIQWLDVGGGLGVDYEGTRSRSYCSMNYSMLEYARTVVKEFRQVCREQGIQQQPHIITESGRAMTAHHALLLAEIIDREHTDHAQTIMPPEDDAAEGLRTLYQAWQQLSDQNDINAGSLVELHHGIQQALDDVQLDFSSGKLSLTQRAEGEQLYQRIAGMLKRALDPGNRQHRDLLDELHEKQVEKIFVNFSLFQSLPDVWGINQIFPIAPLRGHHQPVAHRVVIQDITCDSDGRIDRYVDADGLESSLPLPSIQPGEVLAFFMVGAYQEILGDMHNLFGDTDSVDVTLSAQGEIKLGNLQQGDTIQHILNYVNFSSNSIHQCLHQQVEHSSLSNEEKSLFQQELLDSLNAYTYLSDRQGVS